MGTSGFVYLCLCSCCAQWKLESRRFAGAGLQKCNTEVHGAFDDTICTGPQTQMSNFFRERIREINPVYQMRLKLWFTAMRRDKEQPQRQQPPCPIPLPTELVIEILGHLSSFYDFEALVEAFPQLSSYLVIITDCEQGSPLKIENVPIVQYTQPTDPRKDELFLKAPFRLFVYDDFSHGKTYLRNIWEKQEFVLFSYLTPNSHLSVLCSDPGMTWDHWQSRGCELARPPLSGDFYFPCYRRPAKFRGAKFEALCMSEIHGRRAVHRVHGAQELLHLPHLFELSMKQDVTQKLNTSQLRILKIQHAWKVEGLVLPRVAWVQVYFPEMPARPSFRDCRFPEARYLKISYSGALFPVFHNVSTLPKGLVCKGPPPRQYSTKIKFENRRTQPPLTFAEHVSDKWAITFDESVDVLELISVDVSAVVRMPLSRLVDLAWKIPPSSTSIRSEPLSLDWRRPTRLRLIIITGVMDERFFDCVSVLRLPRSASVVVDPFVYKDNALQNFLLEPNSGNSYNCFDFWPQSPRGIIQAFPGPWITHASDVCIINVTNRVLGGNCKPPTPLNWVGCLIRFTEWEYRNISIVNGIHTLHLDILKNAERLVSANLLFDKGFWDAVGPHPVHLSLTCSGPLKHIIVDRSFGSVTVNGQVLVRGKCDTREQKWYRLQDSADGGPMYVEV